jgi:TRAP-type mannitol/chloroaromatic compound transport system permease small subunit
VERITSWIERTAGYFIGTLAVITFTAAVLRYTANLHIPDGFIVAQTLQGIAICWGFGTAIYADRHITVDILYATGGKTFQRICDVTAILLNLAFMLIFAYAMVYKVFDIQAAGEISDDLRLPLWIGYSLAAIGIVAALVMSGIRTWQVLFHPERAVRNEGGH